MQCLSIELTANWQKPTTQSLAWMGLMAKVATIQNFDFTVGKQWHGFKQAVFFANQIELLIQ